MYEGAEVSGQTEFRNADEEVLKLLEECAELKQALRHIGAQLGRMETRVKRAFPIPAKQFQDKLSQARSKSTAPSISSQEALAEFDAVVTLAARGASEEAERRLGNKAPADLLVIAKELGVAFPKSKPSVKVVRESILGKVREALLLTRHNTRAGSL